MFSLNRNKTSEKVVSSFDNEKALLNFGGTGEDGLWRIRDAYEGVQIFGGIGSGKSSGSGKNLATAFLKNGFGGLVMCAKPDEKDSWIEYAKLAGRTDDLMIFNEESGLEFNPLQYELTREGKGAGEVFNLSNLFMELYKMGNRFTGGGGNGSDRYWDNALLRCLNRTISLLKLSNETLSVENMREVISQALTEDDINSLKIGEGDYLDENYCFNCLGYLYMIRDDEDEEYSSDMEQENGEEIRINKKHEANLVINYFMREYALMDDKTRSIVSESFLGLAEPFLSGILRKHFSGGMTIRPEETFEGKIIILDFSVKEYLAAGVYAQGIFKLLWQQAIERRDVKKYPNPAFLWVDESQYFVSEYDTIFQTTARSSKACTVFLTQNISNYYSQMGGASSSTSKVDSLLGNLSTKIFHCNNDSVTNDWASKVIGNAMIELKATNESKKSFSLTSDSQGTSYAKHNLPQVFPREFTVLKTGGHSNDLLVEAIIAVKGKKWANGANYKKVTFKQF